MLVHGFECARRYCTSDLSAVELPTFLQITLMLSPLPGPVLSQRLLAGAVRMTDSVVSADLAGVKEKCVNRAACQNSPQTSGRGPLPPNAP